MLLSVGDPIPLSCYFHPTEEILTVKATISTRTPYSILIDEVELEEIEGAPGLFGIEVDGMPDVAFVDVFYYAFKQGVSHFVSQTTEQFGRLDFIESSSAYDSAPLVGIIQDGAIVGIVTEVN